LLRPQTVKLFFASLYEKVWFILHYKYPNNQSVNYIYQKFHEMNGFVKLRAISKLSFLIHWPSSLASNFRLKVNVPVLFSSMHVTSYWFQLEFGASPLIGSVYYLWFGVGGGGISHLLPLNIYMAPLSQQQNSHDPPQEKTI
jgi:hypothetical protein